MAEKIRIVVDAMGGDFAPENEVKGSFLAIEERSSLEIILVGKQDEINESIKQSGKSSNRLSVVNANEVISMSDSPAESFRTKPGSSLNVSLDLVKSGDADAVISAGNTGAVLTHSVLKLGRIKGVGRPTIGSQFPTERDMTMVFDVGASVGCKAIHLFEFAKMGTIYLQQVFNLNNPTVGLLSVGEEESKGDEVTIEANKLLRESDLNFIGNVEGQDILKGKSDIVVCDGFVGNIVLKFAESVLSILRSKFKAYSGKSFMNKIRTGLSYGSLKSVLSEFDYQKYGGVPLLGVNGVVIIGHGKSSPVALKNMIFRAEEVVTKNVIKRIEKAFPDQRSG